MLVKTKSIAGKCPAGNFLLHLAENVCHLIYMPCNLLIVYTQRFASRECLVLRLKFITESAESFSEIYIYIYMQEVLYIHMQEALYLIYTGNFILELAARREIYQFTRPKKCTCSSCRVRNIQRFLEDYVIKSSNRFNLVHRDCPLGEQRPW
jgi:hypothetical protein